MRLKSRSLIAAGAAMTLGLGLTAVMTAPAQAADGGVRVLGLSGNGQDLYTFNTDNTRGERSLGKVKGLTGDDTKLIGIDMRPANGRFYGVGNDGGIYTINSANGQAAKVSQLSVDLAGQDFGVDFNPAADRLRIVSDTGQNLRHDVTQANPQTTVDGTLKPSAGSSDTVTGIVGAAYTNNDSQTATGTTLYDINAAADTVAVQSPPNDGVVVNNGPLGLDASGVVGFDIASLRNSSAVTIDNAAFATLRTARTGFSKLYVIDLQSGNAEQIATFDKSIADIAVQHQGPNTGPA